SGSLSLSRHSSIEVAFAEYTRMRPPSPSTFTPRSRSGSCSFAARSASGMRSRVMTARASARHGRGEGCMAVYLDHAATTPMLPQARAAYIEALDLVGNPSSIHSQGQNARRMLEEAREQVAASLGCDPIEVVFTSGGTESVNLAIKGLYWARNTSVARVGRSALDPGRVGRSATVSRPRPRILVPLGEHHATVDTVEWLERYEGAVIEWVPVDALGRVSLDALAAALEHPDDVALVTLLWANNEVGTIQPVAEVVALAAAHGIPVHADAVSAYRHLPIDFAASGLAALSVSAHKIGGPLGIGALALSRASTVVPLIHGGGQQRQVRSGTQDAPAAV